MVPLLNYEKRSFVPPQAREFVGALLDFREAKAYLPEDRFWAFQSVVHYLWTRQMTTHAYVYKAPSQYVHVQICAVTCQIPLVAAKIAKDHLLPIQALYKQMNHISAPIHVGPQKMTVELEKGDALFSLLPSNKAGHRCLRDKLRHLPEPSSDARHMVS